MEASVEPEDGDLTDSLNLLSSASNARVPTLGELNETLNETQRHCVDNDGVKLWSMSSAVVILLGLIGMIEYSLVMPTMESYVVNKLDGDDVFYGLSMASFSLARLFMMPVLGFWGDRRRMIEPFVFSVFLSLVGNFLYGCAEWAGTKWFVLLGRSLIGMGAANSTISMSYITRITNDKNRTQALATLNGLNLLGIVMGPAFNLAIAFTWAPPGVPSLEFNKFTNPGFVMAFILSIFLLLMLYSFKEPPANQHLGDYEDRSEDGDFEEVYQYSQVTEVVDLPVVIGNRDYNDVQALAGHSENVEDAEQTSWLPNGQTAADVLLKESWRCIYKRLFFTEGLWIHFQFSFVSTFILAELETSLPKLTTVDFGWNTLENSLMYAVIGIITAVTLIGTAVYSGRVSDRAFMLIGMILYGIALSGALVFLRENPNVFMFCFVSTFFIIASPLLDSPNMAFYSKRLQRDKPSVPYLGLFISFLQASNSVSRTVAPLYAGWALMNEKNHTFTYLGPSIMWAFSAITLVFYYPKLKVLHRPDNLRTGSIASFNAYEQIMQSPLLTPITN